MKDKTCSKCQKILPVKNFRIYFDKRKNINRYRGECKDCAKKYSVERFPIYYQKNKKKLLKKSSIYAKKNREKINELQRKNRAIVGGAHDKKMKQGYFGWTGQIEVNLARRASSQRVLYLEQNIWETQFHNIETSNRKIIKHSQRDKSNLKTYSDIFRSTYKAVIKHNTKRGTRNLSEVEIINQIRYFRLIAMSTNLISRSFEGDWGKKLRKLCSKDYNVRIN